MALESHTPLDFFRDVSIEESKHIIIFITLLLQTRREEEAVVVCFMFPIDVELAIDDSIVLPFVAENTSCIFLLLFVEKLLECQSP